jgi:hypothetical protein
MKTKHTPPPWVSDGRDIHYDGPMEGFTRVNGVIASTRPGPFRVVGASGLSTSITPEEESANAALIAAAPEIFRALREVLEIVDNDGMLRVGVLEFARRVKAAREALAKATGSG